MCYAAMSITRGTDPPGSALYPIEVRHISVATHRFELMRESGGQTSERILRVKGELEPDKTSRY